MREIKTILFATDFSEATLAAAESAIMLTKLTGARLHVLHVINELEEPQRVMIPLEAFQLLQTKIENQAIEELERFRREQGESQAIMTHARVGVPFQKILELSEEVSADLIVLGTHGRTGLGHILLGSTAERVLQRSKAPVLTVRGTAT